jgi:hypothetical protein
MRPFFSCSLLVAVTFLAAAFVSAAEPAREILGLRLSMPREAAHERLKAIGKFERDERKRQEIWAVKDNPHFSHVVVGFDASNTLRFITAVSREDGEAKRLRYSDVGSVDAAQQAGDPKINNFHYQWMLPKAGDDPETMVAVRGRDPELLTTYSLKRLSDESGSPAKGEDDEK